MQKNMQIYADEVLELVEKIEQICDRSGIPMVMAFCLDLIEKDNGKMQMTIAGTSNLKDGKVSPDPMLLAADILQIPGFDFSLSKLNTVQQ